MKTPLTFEQGYVCAVANLIRMHDCPTMAQDVLAACGRIDWKIIASEDKKILRKAKLYDPRT